jgi:hypothetical protein
MIENLHQKEITKLKQKELIDIFLSAQKTPFQLKYHELRTTFSVLMESIAETFKKRSTKDILPIMGMFSVLDILGSAFSIKGNQLEEKVPIKRCLIYFTDRELISLKDIEALYALRNSLVHNSSLISIPIYTSQNHYFFRYDCNSEKLITHPENDWDGKYESLDTGSEKYTTRLNTELFLSIINSCVEKIKNLSDDNKIEMNYDKGKREFFYRYFRLIKNKFNEKEQVLIEKKALSNEVKGKIDEILEDSQDLQNFTIVDLGTKDSYSDTFKKSHIILEHEDSLVIREIKRILDIKYNNNMKHNRDLAPFYNRDTFVSSKYRIELLTN